MVFNNHLINNKILEAVEPLPTKTGTVTAPIINQFLKKKISEKNKKIMVMGLDLLRKKLHFVFTFVSINWVNLS